MIHLFANIFTGVFDWVLITPLLIIEAATRGVLRSCSYKFRNIPMKLTVLKSFFDKVFRSGPATLFKRVSNTGAFM